MPERRSTSISLRSLEVFEALARTGSVHVAARMLGMSAPAASQQLRNLEAILGQPLIDHARRPLELTRAGRTYLTYVREALGQLRLGADTLSLIDLSHLRRLSLGVIEDLDSEVTPRLTLALRGVLKHCDLRLSTGLSHLIVEEVEARKLDVGLAARPLDLPVGVAEVPLLRDPFFLVAPQGQLAGPPETIKALSGLPFLRYEPNQLISRQVTTHLARLKLALPGRIEVYSNETMFGLIASGAGWTITTVASYLRAQKFHARTDVHPLPFAGFSRTISLLYPSDWSSEIPQTLAGAVRTILLAHFVEPGLAAWPWLNGSLIIVDD